MIRLGLPSKREIALAVFGAAVGVAFSQSYQYVSRRTEQKQEDAVRDVSCRGIANRLLLFSTEAYFASETIMARFYIRMGPEYWNKTIKPFTSSLRYFADIRSDREYIIDKVRLVSCIPDTKIVSTLESIRSEAGFLVNKLDQKLAMIRKGHEVDRHADQSEAEALLRAANNLAVLFFEQLQPLLGIVDPQLKRQLDSYKSEMSEELNRIRKRSRPRIPSDPVGPQG